MTLMSGCSETTFGQTVLHEAKKEISMSSRDPREIAQSENAAAELMSAHGIRRIQVDYFHYRSFRYTNLADAVAQADRDAVRKTLSLRRQVPSRAGRF
jgi:hypothetical protein